MIDPAALALVILGLPAADRLARPGPTNGHGGRSLAGLAVLLAAGAGLLGGLVVVLGAWMPAAVLTVMIAGAVNLISNIKRDVLGEPLVFTDFALVGAVFQQPQFYLSALRAWHIAALCLLAAALVGMAVVFANANMPNRLVGLGLMVVGLAGVHVGASRPRWQALAADPDLSRDVQKHGLIAILLIYWRTWVKRSPTLPCTLPRAVGEAEAVVVVVQCESFADPQDLFGPDERPLSGLAAARAQAWQAGQLAVSGFGAYTMRTEFGALFGIPERALGLERFDPYLTAASLGSWALPNRLARGAWRSVFVHPHDLRFYGRDQLMPVAGFDAVMGQEEFPRPALGEGRYVTDTAVGDKLIDLAQSAEGRLLIYAVTIENHGPWSAGGKGPEANKAEYRRLLQRSDDLLTRLLSELSRLGRPATLCFFGDHRPSIPSVSVPGGDRHTPYVIVRFDAQGYPVRGGDQARILTPAELSEEILAVASSGLWQ